MLEMKRTEHIGSDVLSRYSMTFGTMDKILLRLYKEFLRLASQELDKLEVCFCLYLKGPKRATPVCWCESN